MENAATANVGTKLLFSNDRVRVWDFALEPGQKTDLHSHSQDHLYVYVTDKNNLEVDILNGEKFIQEEKPDGWVRYFEVGPEPDGFFTHTAKNVGDKPHRQIVIEFLGPSLKR